MSPRPNTLPVTGADPPQRRATPGAWEPIWAARRVGAWGRLGRGRAPYGLDGDLMAWGAWAAPGAAWRPPGLALGYMGDGARARRRRSQNRGPRPQEAARPPEKRSREGNSP